MTSTVFIDKATVIEASWLNDVNTMTYSSVTSTVFIGDGATLDFTLPLIPFNLYTQVTINGVYQLQSSYTRVVNLITFSEAPPFTSTIEVIYYVAP